MAPGQGTLGRTLVQHDMCTVMCAALPLNLDKSLTHAAQCGMQHSAVQPAGASSSPVQAKLATSRALSNHAGSVLGSAVSYAFGASGTMDQGGRCRY